MKLIIEYTINSVHKDLIVSSTPLGFRIPSRDNIDFDVELTFNGENIFIEREISYSRKTQDILESAHKGIDDKLEAGEYLNQWHEYIEKNGVNNEIIESLRQFDPYSKVLINEIFTCLNASPPYVNLNEKIYFISNESNKIRIEPYLHSDSSRRTTLTLTQENLSEVVNNYNSNGETLYAFKVLNKSRQQEDLNFRVVEIAMAAEMAIKEFYCKKIPELSIMLTSIQSPPIADLYGKIFKNYFNTDFRNKNKIRKLIETRNKIVHTSSLYKVSHDEVREYEELIQESLAFLQASLVGSHNFLDNMNEFSEIEKHSARSFNINMTAKQTTMLGNKQCIGQFAVIYYISYKTD